ncbi:MAG: hypothetical protein ACYTBZ_06175 [Planctomycetota bacterium]|jgi:V/A-type H+-transporting ATPase subunit E
MAETVEEFVNKLQADGVKAGQQAAEKIRADAELQAGQLIKDAEEQAKKIIEQARAESEKIRIKTETELKLATRDTILRLQDTLNRALKGVLTAGVTERFNNTEFLGKLVNDVVMQYAQADIKGTGTVTINVTENMQHELAQWAIDVLHRDVTDSETNVDLHGTLSGAGFEYKVSEGTVEITVESVVEFLSGLLGHEVRKIVAAAVTDDNK